MDDDFHTDFSYIPQDELSLLTARVLELERQIEKIMALLNKMVVNHDY